MRTFIAAAVLLVAMGTASVAEQTPQQPPPVTDRRWTAHLLAAVQYVLRDLEADATPAPRGGAKRTR